MKKVLAIINPTSGGGTARRQWPHIHQLLDDKFDKLDVQETTAVGDARTIAAQAVRQGYELVIACGGDGTIHEVTNGLCDAGGLKKTKLGVVSLGTGGDFIKSLGIPKEVDKQVDIIAQGKDRRVDLGEIDYTDEKGKRLTRNFVNVVSAGLGAEVVRRVHRSRAFFGKKLAYLASTLESYWSWKPSSITIQTDGSSKTPLPEKPLIVVIANGGYFGGGMPIAPKADPTDGYLDLVVVGPVKPIKIPMILGLLYSKRFYDLDEVYYDRVRSVRLTTKSHVELEIDGEPIGALPASFHITPKALIVRAP